MQRVKKHTSAPTKNCVSAANKFVPLILRLKCLVCITNTLRGLGSDLRPYHLGKNPFTLTGLHESFARSHPHTGSPTGSDGEHDNDDNDELNQCHDVLGFHIVIPFIKKTLDDSTNAMIFFRFCFLYYICAGLVIKPPIVSALFPRKIKTPKLHLTKNKTDALLPLYSVVGRQTKRYWRTTIENWRRCNRWAI